MIADYSRGWILKSARFIIFGFNPIYSKELVGLYRRMKVGHDMIGCPIIHMVYVHQYL